MAETLSGTQKSAIIDEALALRQQPRAWHTGMSGGKEKYTLNPATIKTGCVSEGIQAWR